MIGKDKRAGRDARSISVLLKDRQNNPRRAAKSLRGIGLGGVREFNHTSLLERQSQVGVKRTSCASVFEWPEVQLFSEFQHLWACNSESHRDRDSASCSPPAPCRPLCSRRSTCKMPHKWASREALRSCLCRSSGKCAQEN